ncbi:MAG: HAMP domain-containing protein [Magnetococcales bacterium]|nr:HAMP domain-containing protein [Magnetococcales bacterium]
MANKRTLHTLFAPLLNPWQTLRRRLFVTMLVGLLLTIAVGSYGLRQIIRTGEVLERISTYHMPLIKQIGDMEHKQLEQVALFQQIIRHTVLDEQQQLQQVIAHYRQLEKEKQSIMAKSLVLGRALLEQQSARPVASASFQKAHTEFLQHLEQLQAPTEHLRHAVESQLDRWLTQTGTISGQVVSLLEEEEKALYLKSEDLLQRIENLTSMSVQYSERVERQALWMVSGMVILAILLGIALTTTILKGILNPLQTAKEVAQQISRNDYAIEWPDNRSHDELGELLEALHSMSETIQQTQRALELEQKELTRSNDELQQFAYVASHDLQEPLRAVASFAELLRENYHGRLDEDADEFIDFIFEGATRMQHLINALLAYSRIHTHAQPHEPVSLETVLEDILQNLSMAIQKAGAKVIRDRPLPTIMGDAVQMGQLLQNLISNAIKFQSDNPPRIQIDAQEKPEGWTIRVKDNGIGLDEQYKERIFAIFQRLHTRDEYEGTGIGLAVCKRIVEQHHGSIQVTSSLGTGATFSIDLPRVSPIIETQDSPPNPYSGTSP